MRGGAGLLFAPFGGPFPQPAERGRGAWSSSLIVVCVLRILDNDNDTDNDNGIDTQAFARACSTMWGKGTMQDRPVIKTAIPKRRWQIGDFSATLLGDIDSGDAHLYRWVLALVALGDAEPSLYVTAEEGAGSDRAAGRYQLRVISDALTDIVDTSDRWHDLDIFAEQALDLARQVLGLGNQEPLRLI